MKPLIDIMSLKKMLGSDILVDKVPKSFYKHYCDFNEQIESLEKDFEARNRYLHGLKGASGSIQAMSVYKFIVDLEKVDESEKNSLIPKLKVMMNQLLDEIKTNWKIQTS